MKIDSLDGVRAEVREFQAIAAKGNLLGGHRALLDLLDRLSVESRDNGCHEVVFDDPNFGPSSIHEFADDDEMHSYCNWLDGLVGESKSILENFPEEYPGEFTPSGLLEQSREDAIEAENKEDPLTYRQRCGKRHTDGG